MTHHPPMEPDGAWSHAGRHALRFDRPVNNLHEAPVIGNGDLAAQIQTFQNEVRLTLGAQAIFDARFNYDLDQAVFSQADLIEASRSFGFRLEGANYANRPMYDREPPVELAWPDDEQSFRDDVHPCPKPAGRIRVRHSGLSSTRVSSLLSLADGVFVATFGFDHGWHGRGALTIRAWVAGDRNTVVVRCEAAGLVGQFWLCVEKPPDQEDPTVPLPEVRAFDDQSGELLQHIAAEYDVPAFWWRLRTRFAGKADGQAGVRPIEALPFMLRQRCALADRQAVTLAVDVDCSRCPSDAPVETAAALSPIATPASRDVWRASAIELEDKALEAAWYRDLYALSCHLAPGAHAPGLCANVPVWDRSPWHGVYTLNMNIQKMFLASLPTGHPEWLDSYLGWLDHMRPSMRRLAKTIFGIDGIYATHMMMPWVPPHRQFNSNTCGRALGMTGWLMEPLWLRWSFTQDRGFLEHHAWPWLRDAADFYADYLDRFMDASGDLYPSLILESPPWTRDFEGNRDCFTDLILVRGTLDRAIEAGELVGAPSRQLGRWRDARDRVRPLTWEQAGDASSWIRWSRHAAAPDGDWPADHTTREMAALTAAWSVFPGECVIGDEPDGLAAACRSIMQRARWHELHPRMVWIHHWWCALPALRLGLPEAFDVARSIILKERFPAGHARTTHYVHLQPDAWRCPEDNYLGVVATTEMLLQSQGGVVRLFPGWPRDQAARFRDLPARGGLVISASWSPTTGLDARIRGLAGGVCRLRWTNGRPPTITTMTGEPATTRTDSLGRLILIDLSREAEVRVMAPAL